MYCPYLTLRRAEKQALKNVLNISKNKNIQMMPIINLFDAEGEEVSNVTKNLESLLANECKFVTIMNPMLEDIFKDLNQKYSNILKEKCIIGISDYSDLNKMKEFELAFIHDNIFEYVDSDRCKYHIFTSSDSHSKRHYEAYPKEKRIKIENSFKKQSKNANYPQDSEFSNLYLTYKEDFIGFGDYTILPKDYSIATGGNANLITAAIHLTYKDKNEFLRIKHFTKSPSEISDNKARVMETIKDVLNNLHYFYPSKALDLLKTKSESGTSLGFLKQVGIQHHIEFTLSLLNK